MEKWINQNTDNGFKNDILSVFQKDFIRMWNKDEISSLNLLSVFRFIHFWLIFSPLVRFAKSTISPDTIVFSNIGCLSIHGALVTANNLTTNNNVFFFVSDSKIVYYHHVALPAQISLRLCHHLSLSSIAPRRSSRLYPVLAQSCCI